MAIKEKVTRIPWKEYLSKQMVKVIGFLLITFLLIAIMIISSEIQDLSISSYTETNYIIAAALSSLCFFLVLFGFSKIILFDMADEFGLRDDSGNMCYNRRFWLFTILALSFCSAIYLLLDVLLQDVYLELFPVMLMRIILDAARLDIPGLTNLDGREFYQTARNLYFGFFFILIILFSVVVFLAILTTFARRRVIKRFKKEEEEVVEEKEGIRTIYKLFIWLLIPYLIFFILALQDSPLASIFTIGYILALVWWVYQLLKAIFLVIWKGVKVTAFITSVNLLVIVPLIFVLWILPAVLWGIWNTIPSLTGPTISIPDVTRTFLNNTSDSLFSFESLIQLDFVLITVIATLVVGFAEGFAIIAIFTALARGFEVARTGQVLARSPPKVMVLSKYIVMLGVWASLLWDSLADVLSMVKTYLNFDIPIEIPDFFHVVYHQILIPFSDWLAGFLPSLEYILFLLILPIYFIFSGAFKFLSVTLVTPRVKERAEVFFLLISTAFVLIVTNILEDIYEIQTAVGYTGIVDAPLISLGGQTLFRLGVTVFENVEAIAFYGGFFFGIFWVILNVVRKPEEIPTPVVTTKVTPTTPEPSKEVEIKEPVPIKTEKTIADIISEEKEIIKESLTDDLSLPDDSTPEEDTTSEEESPSEDDTTPEDDSIPADDSED
jgi:hypothetical protein